ncbi:DedA family protein [Actinoplanes sp. NPDC051851]|uniref:DedA family protein n=1 Tax=Actinoplanes sp. NPDC051851 TaxID=3154753 RepID=UPI003414178F
MPDHLMPLICSPWLYLIVFVAVTVDGFLPFLPSETLVIGLGALSATGEPNVAALAGAVVAGGVAGDRISYLLGRRAGRRITNAKFAAARGKAERALTRYGATAILVGRFLPYGRTATTLAAGSVALPLRRFGVFSALACAAWAVYAIGLGRLGGAVFSESPLLGAACGLAIGSALAGVHAFIGKRIEKRVERRQAIQRAAVRHRCLVGVVAPRPEFATR